jgi:hypothetical protein
VTKHTNQSRFAANAENSRPALRESSPRIKRAAQAPPLIHRRALNQLFFTR